MDPEDDFAHELHQRGEQEFAGILLRGGAFEEGINPVGGQQALSHAPGHDTAGAFLDERGKHGVSQPPCHLRASCVVCYLRQQFTKYGQMLKGLPVRGSVPVLKRSLIPIITASSAKLLRSLVMPNAS